MSRTTIFKEGAWISGYEYSDKDTLQRDIDKKEADVNCCKEELLALAMATPKDITSKGADPFEYVKMKFDEIFDELQEHLFQLHALYLIQHNEEYVSNAEYAEPTILRRAKTGYIGPDYYDMKFR